MITGALFAIALDALRVNKLRSSLTLLGVMIGVTSVMTIISALEGMSQAVEDDLSRLGPSTFIVQKFAIIRSEEEFRKKIKRKPIKEEAVRMIGEQCDLVEKISSRAFDRASVKYQDETLRSVLVGAANYNYIDIVDIEVAQGRFHSYEDDLYRKQVVFIGSQIKETLFPNVDPIGKEIKIGAKSYTIIGLAKKMGSVFGNNKDNFVLIPMTTFEKQFGVPRRGLSLVIKAKSVEELPDAMDQVRVVLRSQRHVPFNEEDDFDMVTADSILEILNSITRIIRLGLIGISSISVVVGGIVVMNIMMVAVSERTREIGIRKSLGAKRSHIRMQFLFESLLITFGGGLVGILAGFILAKTLLLTNFGMEIKPSILAITIGFSISTIIGLVFGIYPAMKAAKLDPIKALSYE